MNEKGAGKAKGLLLVAKEDFREILHKSRTVQPKKTEG